MKKNIVALFLITFFLTGCEKEPGAVVLSTAPVNYEPETSNAVTLSDDDILSSIKSGTLLSSEQAKAVAADNLEKYKELKNELLECVNQYRAENNLSQLVEDEELTLMAMHRAAENAHMEWMETTQDAQGGIHHLRPDGSYITGIYAEYEKYGDYGEILGRKQENVESVMIDWKNSPEHNACMLACHFLSFGAGIAQSESGDFYYVIEFLNEK